MTTLLVTVGTADQHKVSSTVCPLCRSTQHATVAGYRQVGDKKYGCSLENCHRCGHFFTHTSTGFDTAELYASEQYELLDTRNSIFGRLISIDAIFVLGRLARLVPHTNSRSILDFGCGKGVFLSLAAQRRWRAIGIETAPKRADFARAVYGLEVIGDTESEKTIPIDRFDVITLFHVLEHLPQPRELVQSLVDKNLKANGTLVIEVPRFDSWQSLIAKSEWIHLDAPRHLSHFSTAKLTTLVSDLGFRIKAQDQFSIHNGVLGMVQSLLSRAGYKKMLIEELKFRRTWALMLRVLMILPLALALELIAVALGRGGIARFYCSRKP